MDEGVPVTRVSGEIEADLVCGLLRSAGIECTHRVTQAIDSAFDNFAGVGPQEVVVHESDLEAARAVLAEAESAADELPD
jgi:putative signal transducing protein